MTPDTSETSSGLKDSSSESEALKDSVASRLTGEIRHERFPIVGIGASAGGLEAFEQFFAAMPADSGMAFVLIQHLDPKRKSILSELLGRKTPMPVEEAEDHMLVEPNHVYTIPPNRNMAIKDLRLLLFPMTGPYVQHTPIDFFLQSLAEAHTADAIGIVLSGSGSEGVAGLRAIKGEGGITLAQKPETASYDSMPTSSIRAGVVDFILSPRDIALQLIDLAKCGSGTNLIESDAQIREAHQDILPRLFFLIRSHTGHDFSYYKESTIIRRVDRRMALLQIDSAERYITYLQKNIEEIDALFKDLLIGVTRFFRDQYAFDALERKVIPYLFEQRRQAREIRIWVPGCATGEEAYSLAILVQEHMGKLHRPFQVQIFATDVDEQAVEKARIGTYPEGIANTMTAERLNNHFVKDDQGWTIKPNLRDMMVFAVQNLASDPPFSRMDLVSCRNLLIYMQSKLQRRLVPLLHYALREEGYLFLGTSETLGEFGQFFDVVDAKARLFRRKPGTHQLPREMDMPTLRRQRPDPLPANLMRSEGNKLSRRNPSAVIHEALLADYDIAAVLIDGDRNAVYFYGPTDRYLKTPTGPATWDVVELVRAHLKTKLRHGIHYASRKGMVSRYADAKVKYHGETYLVDIVIKPLPHEPHMDKWVLIAFKSSRSPDSTEEQDTHVDSLFEQETEIARLEQEIARTRQRLQATIEELETSNEELTATNEELQSSNEELQSTNEELSTAKEEQQSVNEELTTVNAELQEKVRLLDIAQNDMNNLLTSTDIGTIFLDTQLRVMRFTPAAAHVVRLISSDEGRPLRDINHQLRYENFFEDVQQVLATLDPQEREVESASGKWFLTRIRPYRTTTNLIDGVVITFVDITEIRRMRMSMDQARLAQRIVETVRGPLLVLDPQLKVVSANKAFYRMFQVDPQATVGRRFFSLGNGHWDVPGFRQLLERVLSDRQETSDYEVEPEFERIGKKKLLLNVCSMKGEGGNNDLILLAMEEVTEGLRT